MATVSYMELETNINLGAALITSFTIEGRASFCRRGLVLLHVD